MIIFKLAGSPTITSEDFKAALEGFTPAALRGVTLHTAGELGWSDVGGLAAVKEALMETLLWPTKVFIYLLITILHYFLTQAQLDLMLQCCMLFCCH